jgi:hypothetical protein
MNSVSPAKAAVYPCAVRIHRWRSNMRRRATPRASTCRSESEGPAEAKLRSALHLPLTCRRGSGRSYDSGRAKPFPQPPAAPV